MRRPLVAGNWKMNGSREMTQTLVSAICSGLAEGGGADVGICPPYVYLDLCHQFVGHAPIAVGGQDLDAHESGAFTGAVAADMLVDAGCDFVIVGHSERRSLYGEGDADVGVKVAVAASKGLTPIICVGETREERESNVTAEVVCRQLDAVIALSLIHI